MYKTEKFRGKLEWPEYESLEEKRRLRSRSCLVGKLWAAFALTLIERELAVLTFQLSKILSKILKSFNYNFFNEISHI